MNYRLYSAARIAAEFMIRHDPSVESWEDPIGWCAWYIDHGFLVGLRSIESGGTKALAAARPVNHPRDGDTPYKYATGGPCVFVDFLAIEDHDPMVLPTFAAELKRRFGDREQVAFRRIKVHAYDSFLRNIERMHRIDTHVNAQTA